MENTEEIVKYRPVIASSFLALHTPIPSKNNQIRIILDTILQAEVSIVLGVNQTNQSTNKERPCNTTQRIKNELSFCHSLLCLDLVRFPVMSPIKPQAPLLVVPSVSSFLYVSALRSDFSQNPTTLIVHKVLKQSYS